MGVRLFKLLVILNNLMIVGSISSIADLAIDLEPVQKYLDSPP